MSHTRRTLGLLCIAALTACAPGCFGVTQNPSYFPYLLPTGDIIRTHAKPIGPGYYANFDPHAVDLALEPMQMTSQVGSQVIGNQTPSFSGAMYCSASTLITITNSTFFGNQSGTAGSGAIS